MRPAPFIPRSDTRVLLGSAAAACFVELIVLTVLAYSHARPAHLRESSDNVKYIETTLVRLPEEAKLTSEKPVPRVTATREPTLSRVANQGRKPRPEEKAPPREEENKVEAAPPSAPVPADHGPVAMSNPAPIIPEYLRDEQLETSVIIEFAISAAGKVSPRLLSSSGNEELDAVALTAVKQWQFRPAEKGGKAVDSKIRLRILFEVD